MQSTIY